MTRPILPIGDPRECLRHAKHCIEMAEETTNDHLKHELMNLATTWMRLADEVSRVQIIVDEVAKHKMFER
jgi:hypothetical protein